MGPLVWPEEVMAYLATVGRKPQLTAPAKEMHARRQAGDLVPVLGGLRFSPRSVLDIGCGLALIDIFLAEAFAHPMIFHLLDAREQGERRNSYNTDTQAWNDVAAAAVMFRANITEAGAEVITHYAGDDFVAPAVDMVLSSRSWGHHYPIGTYARQVARCLNPGGLIVTDIRHRTDGVLQLGRVGFQVVAEVPDPSHKCARLVFKRKGD